MKILSALAALMILSAPCYSQDSTQGRAINTIEGGITSVDWVGSVIAVNDILISVPGTARIYKGTESTGLDDINMGDPVTVTYYDDPPGVHNAITIIVQYNGDFAV